MGRRCVPTRATGPMAGRSAVEELQEPFARLEYDYAELNKDGWRISCPTCPSGVGGGVPVVDGDLNVQSVTARLITASGVSAFSSPRIRERRSRPRTWCDSRGRIAL